MTDVLLLAAEALVALAVVTGAVFGLIGSYGLLKLRDPMQRLHAPTKATTVGVGTALLASAFDLLAVDGRVSMAEILVAAFLLVTAPLSALYLAKTHLHRTVDRRSLPPTGTPATWATLTPDAAEGERAKG
jgi:multicomponent K+:H+ antiporter subunit G